MTSDEIVEAISKLSYQVSLLGQTIDYRNYPVESLVLAKNWGERELEKAHDIFEHWDGLLERGEKMQSGDFEGEFRQELGESYQGLKSIILAFHRNSQWTNVCEAYVDSFGKTPSVEFNEIARRER